MIQTQTEDHKTKEEQFTYEDGSVYRGEFVDNRRNGYGEIRYKDGNKYIGTFKDDKREGYGIYQHKDGDRYEGYFVNNKREGFGTYYYRDHTCVYHGYFQNNRKHGHGIIKYDDDVVISGIFTNGDINEGNITFSNGSSYFGGINSYLMSGDGYLKYSDDFIVRGKFDKDYLVIDGEPCCCFCCEMDCDGECYEFYEGLCGKPHLFTEESNQRSM